MTLSELEYATFEAVAYHLNRLRYHEFPLKLNICQI
jgi:hypothetical protein